MTDFQDKLRRIKIAPPVVLDVTHPTITLPWHFKPRHLFTSDPGWSFQLLQGTVSAFIRPIPSDLFLLSDYTSILQELAKCQSEEEYERKCYLLHRFKVDMYTMHRGNSYTLEVVDQFNFPKATVVLTGYTTAE